MPEFMLTDPSGKTYKLKTPDGITHEDAEFELARTMTHQPEQPNQAQPYLDAFKGLFSGIDLNPVHLPGTRPADYLSELARNPDILAKNIDQASNFNFGGATKGDPGGRLPQPPSGMRPDRPINPETLGEMRANLPELNKGAPAGDPRPINQQTLDEMRAAQAQDAPEKITAAAVRHQGNIYTGTIHSDAIGDMGKKLGYSDAPTDAARDAFFAREGPNIERGFVTSKGRYLSRGEAADLVGSPDATHAVGKEFGGPPLDERPINPQTLAEMRANDPLGTGPLSQTDPLLSK